MWILSSKKVPRQNLAPGEYKRNYRRKELRGGRGRILIKNYILIESTLIDVVFNADSEYHIHLNLKLTFDDHSPEIPPDFWSFVL
jgi:hypothetical protein